MPDPVIAREATRTGGRYVTEIDGHTAELTYRLHGSDWIADHTGVPDAIGGRGVGRALVARMVADARAEGVRIIPACPFVAALARRRPDWSDAFAT